MSISLANTAMGSMAYLFLQAVRRPDKFPEAMLEELSMFITVVDKASEEDFSVINATLQEELLEGVYLRNGVEKFEEELQVFYDVIEADTKGRLYNTVIKNTRGLLNMEG